MAYKVVVCQLAGHQSVCGSSEGLLLHHLVVYFSYLHSLNSSSQPVSLLLLLLSPYLAGGEGEISGLMGVHRHLAAEWGQPIAPFKPFTKFLASI